LLVLVLSLVLATLFFFMVGKTIFRKRQVDEVYKKVKLLLAERNQVLSKHFNSVYKYPAGIENTLHSVFSLLEQSAEEDTDLLETIAIENKINQHLDKPMMQKLSETNDAQALHNAILNSNIKFKEAREAFNSAATYHNYSVEYFPTKMLTRILGYEAIPLLNFPPGIEEGVV